MRSSMMIFSTISSWLKVGLALAASSKTIELRHVEISYDESAWLGNNVEIPGSDRTGAAFVNPAQALAALIVDMPTEDPSDSANDMLAKAARASLMAEGIYSHGLSKPKSLLVIESKKLPGGWVCMQGMAKKSAESAETSVTYCAAVDQKFWIYASLETKTTPTQGEFETFRGLLLGVSGRSVVAR